MIMLHSLHPVPHVLSRLYASDIARRERRDADLDDLVDKALPLKFRIQRDEDGIMGLTAGNTNFET